MSEDFLYQQDALGVRQTTSLDSDGTVIVRHTQNVEEILKAVEREKRETNGHEIAVVGKHIGEVPLVLLMDYCQSKGIRWEAVVYGNDHNHVLKDFLRDNRKFATTEARF